MRFGPLTTVIPVDEMFPYDEVLKGYVRREHLTGIGKAMLAHYGIDEGYNTNSIYFIEGKNEAWAKTEVPLMTPQETEILKHAVAAAEQIARSGGTDPQEESRLLEVLVDQLRFALIEDALTRIEEENEPESEEG